MAARDTAVLLVAYGGPTRPEEIRPFLDRVLHDRPVPKERYEEVVRHYEMVGGCSPINRLTFRQAEGLEKQLAAAGGGLPVYVGMRHWKPLLSQTLSTMAGEGRRRARGVILAPHPSQASRESYIDAVEEARSQVGPDAPEVSFCRPFFDHPLFVEALTARLGATLDRLEADRRRSTSVIYTAHSIPVGMAKQSRYEQAIARTAELVSRSIGIDAWTIAYQSRSGNPNDPWLEPDIGDALREAARRGDRTIVVAPIGFVCDHVEVLYDLDIEARGVARDLGLEFHRAATAGDHPAFIGMLAALVGDLATHSGA